MVRCRRDPAPGICLPALRRQQAVLFQELDRQAPVTRCRAHGSRVIDRAGKLLKKELVVCPERAGLRRRDQIVPDFALFGRRWALPINASGGLSEAASATSSSMRALKRFGFFAIAPVAK